MSDPPVHAIRPSRHSAAQAPPPPKNRLTDDIIGQLAPRTVLHVLNSPTGALKQALNSASMFEREFAMRTAAASNAVFGWIEELQHWRWPSSGGSAGFECPESARKHDYIGSLPASQVDQYERRLAGIQRELEALDIEDIKAHVLNNHILPLSRPGTPLSEFTRSGMLSSSSYNRMEDLTAVITAIVVQALPNLAKLSRLLQTWSTRLTVLHRIPPLLLAIEDAEVAIQSGWNAIKLHPKPSQEDQGDKPSGGRVPSLSRRDFEVMKLVIEKKVSQPGRTLDYMLDCLEGYPDTLPEDWLDRMEVVEQSYADWAAACERQMRESEWAKYPLQTSPTALSPVKESSADDGQEERTPMSSNSSDSVVDNLAANNDPTHLSQQAESRTASSHTAADAPTASGQVSEQDPARQEIAAKTAPATSNVPSISSGEEAQSIANEVNTIATDYGADEDVNHPKPAVNGDDIVPIPLNLRGVEKTNDAPEPLRKASLASEADTIVHDAVEDQTFCESDEENVPAVTQAYENVDKDETEHQTIDFLDSTQDSTALDDIRPPPTPTTPQIDDFSSIIASTPRTPIPHLHQDSSFIDEEPSLDLGNESPELPPLPQPARRDGGESRDSSLTHRASSHFGDLSSDLPEVSVSPDIPRTRIHEAEYLEASPPSSPPLPVPYSRESSLAPPDSPLIPPPSDGNDVLAPNTPIDDSFNDEFDDSFSISELTVPFDRRDSIGDQHLRQQISNIIESIPAKIKLASETPTVNLNPPDLQLPRLRKKTSKEPFLRSTSSLSSRTTSRAGTPSFTLAPAKTVRARNRAQQEIKVYHLSRSNGEAPIKLFIRCVGEHGERVMVRVGGGWADLGEYLKEYATHHKRRSTSAQTTVEVKDVPRVPSSRMSNVGSSPATAQPASRPASALDLSPMTSLNVRKTRRSGSAISSESPRFRPKTPVTAGASAEDGPSSEESNRSRSSSRVSWAEDDSSFLGLAGPSGKRIEMSQENKAWVESVKEKVRLASGELKPPEADDRNRFGELGKVGGTKRLFRKAEDRRDSKGGRESRTGGRDSRTGGRDSRTGHV